ncbi:MAG: restriction endonuclease [Oscillospiraceae bacterium]|nr:restriction endonuclease [Oscillospiraceae bacterium]
MSTEVVLTDIYEADLLDGHEFEYWCAALLQCNGFKHVLVTKGSGDQGVDIIAEKDDIKYAIQCKRYNSALNNKPIQEVFTGRIHYDCQVAAVMTNSTFTPGARELARSTGVELWDRYKLMDWLDSATSNRHYLPINKKIKVHDAQTMEQTKKKSYFLLNSIAKHPLITIVLFLLLVIIFVINQTGSKDLPSNDDIPSGITTDSSAAAVKTDEPYAICNGVLARMNRVKANTIDYIGYNETERVLIVHVPKYKSFYCYYDFPADKYNAFLNSESPDTYFNNLVGGQYETTIIPEADAESFLPKPKTSSITNK